MSRVEIKTDCGGFPDASIIDRGDCVIVCANAWPINTTFTISYSEAADIAQKLMDVVSAHIQKAAA